MGQLSFASLARRSNVALSMPGTVPLTLRTEVATFQPASAWSNVISARTSRLVAGVPFLPRRAEKAIEKHAAWAAASSSSGLVLPSCAEVRDAQLMGRREKMPLVTYVIIPEPLTRSPLQTAFAVRTSAMGSLLGDLGAGAGCA